MYKLNSILVFSEDSKKLGEFYKKVFQAEPSWTNGDYFEFKVGNIYFEVGPHSEVHGKSKNPERILLNFHFSDVEKEFKRLKEMGVTVIKEPYKPEEDPRLTIATFADPDGNYFQLVTAWEDFKKS
ncbi:MAG: VOC family protein [Patescibacteria group bacterium]|jgi:predicted enzyme related to lactoylglutathione lyase